MNFPLVRRSALESVNGTLQELKLEYQNFRRRNADTQATAYRSGKADAALAFLPVYDNLLRALEQPCGDEAYVTGIQLTMRSLQDVLASLGVTEIPALGQPFNPMVHEAMDHVEDPDLGENVVAKVVLTGFYQEGSVLRHALVIVAN